jgi:hypothetical protein
MPLLLDGFALNIGDATQGFLVDALSYLFGHAATTSFKLYISMDVYASGDACYKGSTSCNGVSLDSVGLYNTNTGFHGQPYDYDWIFHEYLSNGAYLWVDGKPFISSMCKSSI